MGKRPKKNEQTIVGCITGASRGIGYQIARHLAPHCGKMLLAAKTERNISKAARRLTKESECQFHAFWGDLADGRKTADALKQRLASFTEKLDILVLDAGYYVEGSLAEIGDEDFERNMRVNCMSSHYIVSALLPLLRKSNRARIVIIGSTAAYEPYPLVPTYGIAKWALRGLAVNLRKELMSENIGVTFISPGGTLTDMWADVELPKARLLEPSDIAKLIAATLTLSPQAVVEEIIVRPMLGDMHE